MSYLRDINTKDHDALHVMFSRMAGHIQIILLLV